MIAPFALLEDTETGTARLYRQVVERIAPTRHEDVPAALARIEALRREGAYLAGHLGYEAGLALEDRLAPLRRDGDAPLVNVAAYAMREEMPLSALPGWLEDAGEGRLSAMRPAIDETEYGARVRNILSAIRAGDIYQANLTFPLTGTWSGDPLAIWRDLRARAGARFGAVLFDGSEWLLSFSPELFFRAEGDAIEVRPMKGTRPRTGDAAIDAANAADLSASRKDKAENLMITDLMRNDLSRIAVPGSVRVEDPFRIETYPTVFQMTSTVRARLSDGFDAARTMQAIFPCGSITGAPKLRAMEIIDEVEGAPRGPYCGAIGELDSEGARFNVAIRTLRLKADGTASYGVGSGIVADSDPAAEWAECLSKARFLAP